MNITFLLGNGFDIGLGLKTSYEDFYKEYCKRDSSDNSNIADFKRMLEQRNVSEDKIIDWADFESAFGEHSLEFDMLSKSAYIERFEHFVLSFNEYLENEVKKLDYSNSAMIAQKMKTAVTTYFHIREGDRENIQAVYNRTAGTRVYNFISFNYTKTVDKCAKLLQDLIKNESSRQVGKVLHVHGFIEENMIMGVNDASQIKKTLFANDQEIISELVKPLQNAEARTAYDTKVTEMIRNSDVICIYGMSLGKTDKKWWQCITEWLTANPKSILVILKHEEKYNKRFTFTQKKYIDDILERFLSYSNLTLNVRNDILKRIFVGVNQDVFSMSLCSQNNSSE